MNTPDSTGSTPASTTPATSDKPKQHHGLFNKAQLAEITLCEDITTQAAKDPYKTALAGKRIDPAFVANFANEAETARQLSEGSATGKGNRSRAKLNATGAERNLLIALHAIQSAAKQQSRMDVIANPPPAHPVDTAKYLFSRRRLNGSRSLLLQNSRTLIDQVEADALPGYEDAAAITAVETLRTAYSSSKETQTDTNKETKDERIARDHMIERLVNQRLAIQHAIDGLYSYTDDANEPTRSVFHLPLDRILAD